MSPLEGSGIIAAALVVIGNEGELVFGGSIGDEADEQSGDASVAVVKWMNAKKAF